MANGRLGGPFANVERVARTMARLLPPSGPLISRRIPSSVNNTLESMISDPGNLTPFIASDSKSRMTSTMLGMCATGRSPTNSLTAAEIILPRCEVLRMWCWLSARISVHAPTGSRRPTMPKSSAKMPALLPAQPFAQGPIDQDQFARTIVIKKIAGMRVAMKYDVRLGGE